VSCCNCCERGRGERQRQTEREHKNKIRDRPTAQMYGVRMSHVPCEKCERPIPSEFCAPIKRAAAAASSAVGSRWRGNRCAISMAESARFAQQLAGRKSLCTCTCTCVVCRHHWWRRPPAHMDPGQWPPRRQTPVWRPRPNHGPMHQPSTAEPAAAAIARPAATPFCSPHCHQNVCDHHRPGSFYCLCPIPAEFVGDT
jgi:hypothetical protein